MGRKACQSRVAERCLVRRDMGIRRSLALGGAGMVSIFDVHVVVGWNTQPGQGDFNLNPYSSTVFNYSTVFNSLPSVRLTPGFPEEAQLRLHDEQNERVNIDSRSREPQNVLYRPACVACLEFGAMSKKLLLVQYVF